MKIINIYLLFLLVLPVNALSEELRIGVLPPMTGPFADIGDDCRRGVEAAAKKLAPQSKIGQLDLIDLKLIYGDSQADPKVGITEFKKLTEQDKVLGVVSIRSGVCLAINPISKQKHVPLICGSGHPNFVPGNEFAYQSWPLTEIEGGILADYILSQNVKDIAVITGEDEWLLSYSTKFKEHFESKGGKVLISEEILSTDYDSNSLLTKIRAKNPGALFVNISLAQGAIVIKRARELGLKMPIYSNFWSGDASALKAAGQAADGVAYTEANLDYAGFNQALQSLENPKKPSGATISCFASMAAVIGAVKNKKIETSDDLQKALLEFKKIEALDISIPIENRRFMFPMAIKQVRNGKVVKIK